MGGPVPPPALPCPLRVLLGGGGRGARAARGGGGEGGPALTQGILIPWGGCSTPPTPITGGGLCGIINYELGSIY